MNNETALNPVGLYRHPVTKQSMGALHPAQADAFVQAGFQLIREGEEAARNEGVKAPAPAEAKEEEQTPAPAQEAK